MVKIYDNSVLALGYEEPIYERDTSSITEQAGYVDAETQVRRMMVAGATLQDFRRGMSSASFEYPDGQVPDDVVPDPTLDPMFDLSDASAILDRGAAAAAALQKEEGKGETSPVSGVSPTPSST